MQQAQGIWFNEICEQDEAAFRVQQNCIYMISI